MLGRREEELEREEVERQLREVEMQERAQMEAEEGERVERLRGQAAGEADGPVFGDGDMLAERDLDADVPEADDGMGEGDLDDEIPDADEEEEEEEGEEVSEDFESGSEVGQGDQWVYDSRREPDTDEEGFVQHPPPMQRGRRGGSEEYVIDEREALSLANAMLSEDEMGEMGFDEQQEDDAMGQGTRRDLDDDVPDADEGGWEHTDTELEESEMDISILPPAQQMQIDAHRRSSGLPPLRGRNSGLRLPSEHRAFSGNQTQMVYAATERARLEMQSQHRQTPQMSSDMMEPETGDGDRGQSSRRSWLNAASPRRSLFGVGRGNTASGRLFTPSPAHGTPETEDDGDTQEGRPRRRSGRLFRRTSRENRDSVD